jgi:hypothetical protein
MKNSEQPIVPYLLQNGIKHPDELLGLTKREYFAGLAMQGLLTRVPNRQGGETDLGTIECGRIAEEAVIMADKILKELEKKITTP